MHNLSQGQSDAIGPDNQLICLIAEIHEGQQLSGDGGVDEFKSICRIHSIEWLLKMNG